MCTPPPSCCAMLSRKVHATINNYCYTVILNIYTATILCSSCVFMKSASIKCHIIVVAQGKNTTTVILTCCVSDKATIFDVHIVIGVNIYAPPPPCALVSMKILSSIDKLFLHVRYMCTTSVPFCCILSESTATNCNVVI